MLYDVFISYAQENKDIADKICELLEEKEISCWIAPRNILPGVPYPKAIITAIRRSRKLIVIVSKFSNESAHVKVELERAFNENHSIIPIRIDDVKLSEEMEYFISTPQWLDASTSLIDSNIPKLIEAINLGPLKIYEKPIRGIDHLSISGPSSKAESTYVENNSHYQCDILIRHACGKTWKLSLNSGERDDFQTYHNCPSDYSGIHVTVKYSNGKILQGPGTDDMSIFISDNEVRHYKVSSL